MGWFTQDIVSNIGDWERSFVAQRVADENERKDFLGFIEKNGAYMAGFIILVLLIFSLK
jgi:hypothetical protein